MNYLDRNHVVEGNEFWACIPQAEWASLSGEITPIMAEDLQGLRAEIGNKLVKIECEYITIGEEVRIHVLGSLQQGKYDIFLSATYHEREVRAALHEAFVIVPFGDECYLKDGMLNVKRAVYIAGSANSEEEVQRKVEELDRKIEETEVIKAEYEEKLHSLDGIAKETNATSNKEEVLAAMPTGYAKENTLFGSTNAILEAIGGIGESPEQKAARAQLAQAITSKGVETAGDASMQTMADNVGLIQQEQYELKGAQIYEKQMYGEETVSEEPYKQNGPLWNLYKVMTDLLSDARFVNYGGILLAEYYKGYDTIDLMNAGAGGAYFTCDGDFYTTDKSGENAHVWHDDDNGMLDRWVAYFFASEYSNYQIPSTSLCPRSIHIGRKVGTIINATTVRFGDVVVTDGNSLGDIQMNNNTGFKTTNKTVLNNLVEHKSGNLFYSYNQEHTSVVINIKKLSGGILVKAGANGSAGTQIEEFYSNIEEISSGATLIQSFYSTPLYNIILPELSISNGTIFSFANPLTKVIKMPKLKSSFSWASSNANLDYLIDLEVGEVNGSINIKAWRANNIVSDPIKLAKLNANIREHIAARVHDRTGLSALTFTVSTNLYNNLEQATKDAFAAKNWRVAGA